MEKNDEGIIIDVKEIIWSLFRKLPFIIIVTILFAMAGYMCTKIFIVPQYSASAKMIVNNRSDTSGNTVTNSDIAASANLIDTYAVIITSDTVLDPVISSLNLSISYGALAKKVSVSSVNETQVMEISIRDPNPEYAKAVIQEITKIAPSIIVETVKAGSCEIISEARASVAPVSPNTMKNTLIAAFLGMFLFIAVIFIRTLLNNTCKSEEELKELLNLPVLCVIPNTETGGGDKK